MIYLLHISIDEAACLFAARPSFLLLVYRQKRRLLLLRTPMLRMETSRPVFYRFCGSATAGRSKSRNLPEPQRVLDQKSGSTLTLKSGFPSSLVFTQDRRVLFFPVSCWRKTQALCLLIAFPFLLVSGSTLHRLWIGSKR